MGVVEYQGIHRLVAERFSWIVAVWVHVLLFAVLASSEFKEHHGTHVPVPLVVELLPLRELSRPAPPEPLLQAETEMETGAETAAFPDARPPLPGTALPRPEAEWKQATSFYAADVLSDPRSAQARVALATLVSGDRAEQLCALEAMEQVRRTDPKFRPTRLAPHAFRNSVQRKNEIIASAAAVRSNRIWYEIAYRCRLSASGSEVIGFEFALGDPIDRSLWDEHGLAPVH
ncbi:MAG: DUF930 domain-containing protein [Roseibium sp.]|uniref:DUF930 domain-containing protein n=1 Tax=Roseibium sp. TaxID=1936156 RepID=UPI003D9C38A7